MIITREQGQRMVEEYYARWRALAVFYCTGFGKGKAAIDAVLTHGHLPNDHNWKGLIVVHSEPARDSTWPEQLLEWMPDYYGCIGYQITIICYHSLHKYKGQDWNWVICDEVHYITLKYYLSLKTMTWKGILVMTGTKPGERDKKHMIDELSKNHQLTIKLDMAVQSKVLNDYRVRVWKVKMTDVERAAYLAVCREADKAKAMMFFKPMAYKAAIGKRVRFIYNLDSKYKAAKWVCDQIRAKGKRFVIFTGSIEMANKLSRYRIHSQTNSDAYNAFKAEAIDEIASIRMIREGENIKNLQSAVVVQANTKERKFLQELGRLMRLGPGEIAVIHLIVVEDTFDEGWCHDSIKSLDKTKIRFLNIDRNQIEQTQ